MNWDLACRGATQPACRNYGGARVLPWRATHSGDRQSPAQPRRNQWTQGQGDKRVARTGIGSDREAAWDDDQGSSLCRDVADRGYGEEISGPASRAEGVARAKAQRRRQRGVQGPVWRPALARRDQRETGRAMLEVTQGPDCVGHRKPR